MHELMVELSAELGPESDRDAVSRYPATPARSWTAESRLTVEVIRSAEELDRLRPDWLRLEAATGARAVFQRFSQTRIWAETVLPQSDADLQAITVRDGGRPVLILPLMLERVGPLRLARLAGDPISQYSEVLAAPEAGEAAFRVALGAARQAGADVIVLRRIRADSELKRLAGAALRPSGCEGASAVADLSSYPDFPAYLAGRSKRVRQGLRNRRNHIARTDGVRFEVASAATAPIAIAEALDMKCRWMVERGIISTAFADPTTRTCLVAMAALPDAFVTRMSVGGETAAVRFGFNHAGTHTAYLCVHDERFAALAPGKMLMEFTISEVMKLGIGRLDMLDQVSRHKTDWCDDTVASADFTLPLTWAGHAYAALYAERLRPALRHIFDRLPAALRSRAAATLVSD